MRIFSLRSRRALMAAGVCLAALGHPAFAQTATPDNQAMTNRDWWPQRLDLSPLRDSTASATPNAAAEDYAAAFAKVDLAALKADLKAVMTTSQPWWPADYGNYGPFFIRIAWHAAGTYRTIEGRGGADGGQQRFEPLNSWPDNGNLDKARRLILPIKQKYGESVSWGDLMVLAGTVAMEQMGMQTTGFAGGRVDDWQADEVYWGPEKQFMADNRYSEGRKLERPLGAVQMGLIYVNPEGPNGNPDPMAAAQDIRETFARMAMNDEETVALIVGGHTFGKAHGAKPPAGCVGAEPAAAGVEAQGFGWKNSCGSGKGVDTITSGLEGAWTATPALFSSTYLDNLYAYEWVKTKSPAGATQWIPADGAAAGTVPDAHDPARAHAPIMLTTDVALKVDPAYREISQRFQKDPAAFEKAFADAWFKLTHRDMGPRWRYVGAEVPQQTFLWQDPIPAVDHPLIDKADAASLKASVLASGLTVPELVRTAWASAASYRDSDMRGGTDGGRLRLAPQKDWTPNDPAELTKVLDRLEAVRTAFNAAQTGGKRISMADMIVLGGAAAIEQAASAAGHKVEAPFRPGRMDAPAAQTDVASFAFLEPPADGFRNYYGDRSRLSPAEMLVDKADLLDLTAPEMTVLVGGMRALDANAGGAKAGVLTERPGALSADFFRNLMSMDVEWVRSDREEGLFEARDRTSGAVRWTATPVDLAFGSNSELRAVAEHYAADGAEQAFVADFVAAWVKVMNLGRPSA